MSSERVILTCPDAAGELVRVTVLPSVDGRVMVLGPRGGFRLSARDIELIAGIVPADRRSAGCWW